MEAAGRRFVETAVAPLADEPEVEALARGELMRIDPERPALSGYDRQVTQSAKKEMPELLEWAPTEARVRAAGYFSSFNSPLGTVPAFPRLPILPDP